MDPDGRMRSVLGWLALMGVLAAAGASIWREALDGSLGSGSARNLATAGVVLAVGSVLLRSFGPVLWQTRRTAILRRRLAKQGQLVRATIVRVAELGSSGTEIYLEITVRTLADTEATFQTYRPQSDIPKPGDTIAVLYDPEDPTTAVAY
jgi:hypothetical protein